MAKVEITFQALKIKVEDKKDDANDCIKLADEQMKKTVLYVTKYMSKHQKRKVKELKELSKLPIVTYKDNENRE